MGKSIRVPIKRIRCARGSFRYKNISPRKGIKALFCCPAYKFRRGKCKGGMKLVTAVYSGDKWTPAKAKAHAKKRFKKK